MKSDEQLYKEIIEKISLVPETKPYYIVVSVQGGVVTLDGMVRTLSEKLAVERAIKNIEGVKGIANEIKVNLATEHKKSDTEIAQAVITALSLNTKIPLDKIMVIVEDGWVALSGEVMWYYQKQAAEATIENLFGVKGIINDIVVKPNAAITLEVKEKIMSEFERNAIIDAETIRVESEGSKVILKGQVRSYPELLEAIEAAWSVPGVTEVEDRLSIM